MKKHKININNSNPVVFNGTMVASSEKFHSNTDNSSHYWTGLFLFETDDNRYVGYEIKKFKNPERAESRISFFLNLIELKNFFGECEVARDLYISFSTNCLGKFIQQSIEPYMTLIGNRFVEKYETKYTLKIDNENPLVFTGELIANRCGYKRYLGDVNQTWSEVFLFKTDDEKYICYEMQRHMFGSENKKLQKKVFSNLHETKSFFDDLDWINKIIEEIEFNGK